MEKCVLPALLLLNKNVLVIYSDNDNFSYLVTYPDRVYYTYIHIYVCMFMYTLSE